MNYFLMLLIVGVAGFAYYQHNQDEQQVAALQQQLSDLQEKAKAAPVSHIAVVAPSAPQPAVAPLPVVHIIAPATHSSAIDAAAHAATVASTSNANEIGSITTLDGRTFKNCKVLKVESDGVTFSHDDGITKIMYPFLPPDLQKQFGYDPQKATEQAEAQLRFDQQQQQAATNNATTPVTQ